LVKVALVRLSGYAPLALIVGRTIDNDQAIIAKAAQSLESDY